MAHVDETDHVAVKSEDIKIEVKTDPHVSNTNLICDNFRNTVKREWNNEIKKSDLKPTINFFENKDILKTEHGVQNADQQYLDIHVKKEERNMKPIVHYFVNDAILKSEETQESLKGTDEKAAEAAEMCSGTGPVLSDVRSLWEQSKFKFSFFPCQTLSILISNDPF